MDYVYGYDTGSAVATGLGAALGLLLLIWGILIAVSVFIIVCNWKVFKKAGKHGWEAIIPIYNLVVLLEITGQPVWYLVFWLIPGIGSLVFNVLVYLELAKKFGQSTGFGIGLVLLNPIFMAILAFDKKYVYQSGVQMNNSQNYQQPVYNQQPMQQPTYSQPQNTVVEPVVVAPVMGSSQPVQSNTCSKCGAQVNPGDKFCMHCGNQL